MSGCSPVPPGACECQATSTASAAPPGAPPATACRHQQLCHPGESQSPHFLTPPPHYGLLSVQRRQGHQLQDRAGPWRDKSWAQGPCGHTDTSKPCEPGCLTHMESHSRGRNVLLVPGSPGRL